MQKVSKPAQIDLMLDAHCEFNVGCSLLDVGCSLCPFVILMLYIVQTWDDGMEHDRTGLP